MQPFAGSAVGDRVSAPAGGSKSARGPRAVTPSHYPLSAQRVAGEYAGQARARRQASIPQIDRAPLEGRTAPMAYSTAGHPQYRAGGTGRRRQDAAGRKPARRSRRHPAPRQPRARHDGVRFRPAGKAAAPLARRRRSCTSITASGACNLIDTPGYPDFAGRALTVLEAVETAAVVISAVNGIEPMTQRMMEFARDRELCRLIIINKIDSRDAHPSVCWPSCARLSGANACR